MSKFINNYQIPTLYGEIKYNKNSGIKYTRENVSHIAIDIESQGDHIAIPISPEISPKSSPKIKFDNKLTITESIFTKLANFFSS
jgi:hypothetical protein